MDPYADEILEALGLPTSITRFRELDFFQVLGIDPSTDSDDAVIKAAGLRMRKVREFAKGGTRDYSREMELLIIQARNALKTPAARHKYRQQIGIAAPAMGITAESEETVQVRPAPKERTAYDKVQPAGRGGGRGKIFLIVLIILIIIAILAVWKFGPKRIKEGGQGIIERGADVVRDVTK